MLESPDIPASGTVILSKDPQGRHIVKDASKTHYRAVKEKMHGMQSEASCSCFPKPSLRGCSERQYQNSKPQKETVSTYLITAGECQTGKQSFCGVLLDLLWDVSLSLCTSVLFYFGCEPAFSSEPSLQPSLACF